jgi:hypothetical protein
MLQTVDLLNNAADPQERAAAISNLRDRSEAIANAAADADALLRTWLNEIANTPQRHATINFPLIDRAYGKDEPKKASPKFTPSPIVSAPLPQASHTPDKLEKLSPFLWAFLVIPLIFGVAAFCCLFSSQPKVQDFGIATLNGVVGYFFGLGAGGFAIGFG